MKKILVFVLAFVMTATLFAGCTSDADPQSSTAEEPSQVAAENKEVPADDEITIAVVPKALDNAIFLDAKLAAEEKGEELGINVIWTASTASVAADQVTVIEGLIEQGVDAMLISCNDANALVDVINRAVNAGIHVATFDSDSPDSLRSFYIGTINYNAGAECFRQLAATMPEGGEVAILTGVLGAPNLEERIDGFEDAAEGSNITIKTIVSGDDDVAKSVEVVNQYTAANPDLDAWWFDGGWPFFADPDALADFATWRDAGGTVVSMDTFYPMLKFVELDMVDVLVGSDYIAMGRDGVQMLYDMVQGGPAPGDEMVDTGLELCTKDNVEEVRAPKAEW